MIATGLLCASLSGSVNAEGTQKIPSLVITRFKVTSSNGQQFVLYNQSDISLEMGKYQLEYFNNYDIAKSTSSRSIQLSGSLPPHSSYILSDDIINMCYRSIVDSVSLGFSTTAGFVQIVESKQVGVGGLVAKSIEDYVGWSKSPTSGAQTLPSNVAASLIRRVDDGIVGEPGSGSWEQAKPNDQDACSYVSVFQASQPVQPISDLELLEGNEPPYTLVNSMDEAPLLAINNKNIGLMKPSISEILPNPTGTGNDDTAEFIEIYNPNPTVFDLSGFKLETGLTAVRSYVFPEGTAMRPLSFSVFYSGETKLILSNSSGQARLMDYLDNVIAETEIYSGAKDGYSWIIATGTWSWSLSPTPGTSNILNQPVMKKAGKKMPQKGSKTSNKSSSKKIKNSPGVLSAQEKMTYENPEEETPIHGRTLALVGGLALLYAGYEYRSDIGNKIFELRRHFGNWRKARTQP